MSLARQISSFGDGSAARSLPVIETTPRPESRPRPKKARKSNWGTWMMGGLGWACVVVLSLVMVHRNTMVQAELSAVESMKADLAREERLIHERTTKLAEASSMTKVNEWAKAKGMVQPQRVKSVAADPSAVVVAAVQAPLSSPAAETASTGGLFGAVKAYFTRMTAGLPAPGR